MDPACDTLFYPFEKGILPNPLPEDRVLFINAQSHEFLKRNSADWTIVQSFKPYAERLEAQGFKLIETATENYAYALALIPKSKIEAEFHLAKGWKTLKPGGLLLCAAANDAGGTRLEKMLKELGMENVQSLSKNKARVAWGYKGKRSLFVDEWLEQGEIQPILNGAYFSQPGLFGWDKMDHGTALLLDHLPKDLSGTGADFGCGYGALSRAVLQSRQVQKLAAIDADARALSCCARNTTDPRLETYWLDLTSAKNVPQNLDFIVMNPPFHEGKKDAASIGQAFIQTGFECLKRGGSLYMVANVHLPYESLLRNLFSHVENLQEASGFKVFHARK